jgi:hypothetical protein
MDYFPNNASQCYGDAFEGAKTAAFRRCAKEFGVGLQPYRKGFADGWRDRKYQQWEQQQMRPEPQPAKPNGNGNKSHAESVAAFTKWLYEHVGTEIAGWAIPYLRTHTPDGGEASSALMPNEDLTGLTEASLGAIRKDMAGFLERLKAFAEQNATQTNPDAMEGEKVITGILSKTEIKTGETSGKKWTLYVITIGVGNEFLTFSKSVGEAAKRFEGTTATIFYVPDDKGNTARAIKVGDKLTRAGESKEK